MQIEANKLGLAFALAFAILWIICSAVVMLLPAGMIAMSGHMVHADLSGLQWHMEFSGFLVGLLAWTLLAGFTAWVVGLLYNKLI